MLGRYLFRTRLDIDQAHLRRAERDDLPAIGRLLREAERRFYHLGATDLPSLLTAVPTMLLEHDRSLWGIALPGWLAQRVTWLRCVALVRGLDLQAGLGALLPPLHAALRERGVQHMFYAGDEATDHWLIPALQQQGYVADTDVVVYEKLGYRVPTQGNQQLVVRPVRPADLPTLLALDELCFESHWTKPESAFAGAMQEGGFFVVGELYTRIVGYAYASEHFGGRLVHLVRLSVDPDMEGLGVGTRLLAEVIGYAQQMRADMITLNTQVYNQRSQELYRRFGFALNGESQTILRYDL